MCIGRNKLNKTSLFDVVGINISIFCCKNTCIEGREAGMDAKGAQVGGC